MKYIWLGIKDYSKDVYHDWLVRQYKRFYTKREWLDEKVNKPIQWKEGSVWHYIRQRKMSYKTQDAREWVLEEYIKTKQDFIYYIWAALDEIASNGATYEWFVEECNYLCKIAEKRGWL